ncbi:MAG: aminopeptidase N, partial [Desulfopila sp.]|nr:aminopeptidase N [Desulfopila sp.]
MKKTKHQAIFRKDYTPSSYLIENISLLFQLNPGSTTVTAETTFYRNQKSNDFSSLVLDGEMLHLESISLDGRTLQENLYTIDSKGLTLQRPPEAFTLRIVTTIYPEKNSALSGLYRSGGNYCTQCEAEGFRRITYYLDRPDVLATFTTRIEADSDDYKILLSNGNLKQKGTLNNKRHFAEWHDPHPKPSYLFALVAGNLSSITDTFITKSGNCVSLQIYTENKNRNKCDHAMSSLKKAMRWDEEVYGLEYDLDNYMIVAVDDFNMGAMENKGLNIFNSKYVLASHETATDQDYIGIEGVIAHEYFHNWTGNRVTCRDWFQLSLKEGLTVFRDQEFSADMNSRTVQRIDDVNILRNNQFREDAGPMAHPVRPDAYVEVNNFYTVTVYNKGAEVVRMIERILGNTLFRKGMDLYFEKYDNQAVTCDDFVDVMAEASGVDLNQFKLWYSQAGTPVLEVEELWDKESGEYVVTVSQKCPPSPKQQKKSPFHIPIEIGLLEFSKNAIEGTVTLEKTTRKLLELKKSKERFSFKNLKNKPLLSFLRNFSAPVKVRKFQPKSELFLLMAHDDDLFNRWNYAHQLTVDVIKNVTLSLKFGKKPIVDKDYLEALSVCIQKQEDMALCAKILTFPSEPYLAQQMKVVEPELLHRSVTIVKKTVAIFLWNWLEDTYRQCYDADRHSISAAAMAQRSLKNCCLAYLSLPGIEDSAAQQLCLKHLRMSRNMTDVFAALSA